MTGLWLNETTFHDFSANAASGLLDEIAVRGLWSGGALGVLPDPDPVLRERADGQEVLETLTADWKVTACIQGRKVGTLTKTDYHYTPGSIGQEPTTEAQRLCDDVTRDLERVGLRDVFSEILDTPYYGFTPVEILWERGNDRMRIADIVPKPREWFGFNERNQLVFLGEYGLAEARPVPANKFVLVRHYPTYKNPYGLRLLSRCLWPVAFKKGGIEFLMRFGEKFGMPWVVGTARSGATKSEKQNMATDLATMVQDAVAVVSGVESVEIKEPSGKSSDIHERLITLMDNALSMVLMGQTLTQDIGNVGSRAAADTHLDVLHDYQTADELLLCEAMTDLGWIFGQVNAPGVLTPVFGFVEPEDHEAQSTLDTALYGVGLRFTSSHFERRYGLASDEFTLADDQTPNSEVPANPRPVGFDHAEAGSKYDDGQQAIEDLVGLVVPEADAAMQTVMAVIKKVVSEAEDEADLLDRLAVALAQDDLPIAYEEILERALFAADLAGRAAVSAEIAGGAV